MMIYLYLHRFQNMWHVLSRKHMILWRGFEPHLSEFYHFANTFFFFSSFSRQSYWGVNPVKKCSPLLISVTCSFSFFFACFVEYNLRYMSCLIKYVTMWVLTCSDYDNSYNGLHYCHRSSFTTICVCGPYWCRYYCQKVHSHGCLFYWLMFFPIP